MKSLTDGHTASKGETEPRSHMYVHPYDISVHICAHCICVCTYYYIYMLRETEPRVWDLRETWSSSWSEKALSDQRHWSPSLKLSAQLWTHHLRLGLTRLAQVVGKEVQPAVEVSQQESRML